MNKNTEHNSTNMNQCKHTNKHHHQTNHINNEFSLYVHWPFCRKKCSYCDLNSHVRESVTEEIWVNALLQELETYHNLIPNYKLNSIFFGGGTPSLLHPKHIQKIIQHATNMWNTTSKQNNISQNQYDIEITLETNPSSLEANSIQDFKNAGINRMSFGVQSFNDDILKLLNRTHSAQEAMTFIQQAQTIFNNVSVDIMYALPNQTLDILHHTLEQIFILNPKHISIYELTLHKNTLLYHQIQNNELTLPDEDLIFDQYNLILDKCEEHGYKRYEVSNFSKDGYRSQHNMNYWYSNQFVGVGPGAHGRIFLHHNFNIDNNNAMTYQDNSVESHEELDLTLHTINTNELHHNSTNKNNSITINSQCNKNACYNHTQKTEETNYADKVIDLLDKHHNINVKSCNQDSGYSNLNLKSYDVNYFSTENEKIPEKWLKSVQTQLHGLKSLIKIDFTTQLQEYVMMRLRVADGILISDFEERFSTKFTNLITQEKIDDLVKHKYATYDSKYFKLTKDGIIKHGAICKHLLF